MSLLVPQIFAHLSRAIACLLAFALLPSLSFAADADEPNALDEILIKATRMATLIRDEPLRVEAVPAEEIEENLTVQPGNLSSLLNELPGIRVQAAAPALGGAGLQLRGMPARHTVVLTDGLPLLGAEPDAFGLLQTPPLDLAQVEVIKGASSALYGGSALGGVLNLVSQTPDAESGILANATSRGGRDLLGFFTDKPSSTVGGTLTVGAHDQSREDVNGDGWADIASYRRFTLRPRVWWDIDHGTSLFLTAGITGENREGGTLPGGSLPDGTSFPEELRTRRYDGGVVSQWIPGAGYTLTGRLSVTSTHLDRTFGTQRIPSTQTTAFGEEALGGNAHNHAWVLGLAFEHDELAAPAVPGVSYTYNVPAIFAQDEFSPTPWLKLAASARVDAHNKYGTFLSPRLSALVHTQQSDWSVRASVGGGFAAPTPLIDEVVATGLGALLPLRGLHAERAMTASLDAKWADGGWDVNASVFTSEIRDPLEAIGAPGEKLELVNQPGPRRAPGAEALIRYVVGPLQLIASWSHLDATEVVTTGTRQRAPLVPRESGELAGILESEKRGRIGIELGYTGTQALIDDPYRSVTEPYLELNGLGELRFGAVSVFLNAINLTDVRQTHFDPLIRPTPGPGGNPITDVWAPLQGRTFNIGIRAEL
jgi:outer membrane receptor for ferrienterochelin and colicins